jgi:hypothetical protein
MLTEAEIKKVIVGHATAMDRYKALAMYAYRKGIADTKEALYKEGIPASIRDSSYGPNGSRYVDIQGTSLDTMLNGVKNGAKGSLVFLQEEA